MRKFFLILLLILFLLIFFINAIPLYSKYCHFCGSKIKSTEKICTYCKKLQIQQTYTETLVCPVCNAINSSKNRYCTNCGYPLQFMDNEFKIGVIEYYKKNFIQSLKIFNKIIDENKFFYPAIRYKINILYNIGGLKEYLDELINKKITNPEDISLLYELGITYYKNNEKENSLATFQRALEIYPQFSEVYTELYEITKNIEYLKKSIKYKPSFYLPYIKLSEDLLNQGKYEKIPEYLSFALRLFPYDYRIWYIKGRINFIAQNYESQTLRYFNYSIKYNSGFIPSHFYMAKTYLYRNNIIKALSKFKEIIKNSSKQDEILMLSDYYVGQIIDRIVNFDLINLKTAITDDRNYKDYYRNALELFQRIKKFSFATDNEIEKLNELKAIFESYEKGFIDRYEFIDLRRNLFFPREKSK